MSDPYALEWLLASLDPELRPGRFVFVSAPEPPPTRTAVATVLETEGTTLVLEEHEALSLGLVSGPAFAMISLGVHSPVDSVGLTAAVAAALSEAGISCNVIAGAFHDHLFVAFERVGEALSILGGLGSR